MDYLVKLGLIIIFVPMLHFVISKFLGLLTPYLHNISIAPILCQFGIFTGLNLFLSIIVSAFFVKQIISFWK